MASPHPPYSQPGPSSYYQTPPHYQYPYVPGPNPVPYFQHYPVPSMNGHTPVPQIAPPRGGGGRGRYNSQRGGGPNHLHYQHIPQPHMVPSPIHPASISPTSPLTYPQKYPQHVHPAPYSPSYAPQPNAAYPPWSQSLSPLPKQLTMLPPPQLHVASEPESVSPSSRPQETVPFSSLSHLSGPSSPRAPSVAHSDTSSSLDNTSSATCDTSGYVIWSRKPDNPGRAPGLIISPRAYPPEDVIQNALDLSTPPVTPKLESINLSLQQFTPLVNGRQVLSEPTEGSPNSAVVTSSSVTDTTPAHSTPLDTPVPGSPLSSATSVSNAPALSEKAPEVTVATTESTPTSEPSLTASVSPAPQPVTQEPVSASSTQASASSIETSAPTPSSPSPAPVSKPSTAKKSWASLLQPSGVSASSSKSRLPVSSVVGFSIPADAPSFGSTGPATATIPHRNELLTLLNTGPATSNIPLKIRPRGLVNTGNMCFANSVLQVLIYCPPFYRLFSELRKYLLGPVVGSQRDGSKTTPLVDATIQFLKEFVPDPSPAVGGKSKGKERQDDDFDELDSFIPTYVYDAMKEKKRFANMIGGHQEDAEEFLGFFLDTLEEELLSISASLAPPQPAHSHEQAEGHHEDGWLEVVGKKNKAAITRSTKATDSPITRIFGGKFRSTLRAPHQRDSVTVEDWRALRLDIQREQVHSIRDALQYISQPEAVQITSPTRPGVVIEANQQALIESFPPVLILHLKRFLYDTKVGDVVKIGKQVTYTPELEIGPDLIAPTHKTTHPVKYQLFGVLYHHGQSASGGHYTLDVLHPNRDLSDKPRAAWIRIDDELVSDVRPEDVFNPTDRDDRCAYLLFYRRMAGWGTGRP